MTILFSPAYASFDQYENFEERGMEFTTIVSEVIKDRNEIHRSTKSGISVGGGQLIGFSWALSDSHYFWNSIKLSCKSTNS